MFICIHIHDARIYTVYRYVFTMPALYAFTITKMLNKNSTVQNYACKMYMNEHVVMFTL